MSVRPASHVRSPLLLLLLLAGACGSGTDSAETPSASNPRAAPSPIPAPASASPGSGSLLQQEGGRGGRGSSPPVLSRDATHSRSSIGFSKKMIDLGSLYQQDVRELEFPFSLDGPDPVVVTELLPSCGCTGARLVVDGQPWELSKPIPAGAKGAVEATFDSQHYKDDKSSMITVRGNAQNLPVRLVLKAYIMPLFAVLPRMARFDDLLGQKLRRNPNPTRVLEVTGSRPFTIARWEDLPEWATVEDFQREPAPDGQGEVHSLRVALKPDIPVGRHSAVVRGITPEGKEIAFQIYAGIYGQARYFPERIPSFQIQQQGSQVTRKMIIQATAEWLGIPEPEVRYEGDPAFELIFDVLKPNQRYSVEILLNDDTPPGRHVGKVLVTWPPGADTEVQEFPVTVLIRRRP